MKWWHWLVILIVIVGAVAAISGETTTQTPASSGEVAPTRTADLLPPVARELPITMAEYSAAQSGMTEAQVFEIVGQRCEETSRSDMAGFTTVMYSCVNPGGSNAIFMFQNDALIQKSQFGLQ